MHRFFVPPALFAESDGQLVELTGDMAHQIGAVLRLRAGDSITLLDGEGGEYVATIAQVERGRVRVKLGTHHAAKGEPSTQISLYQSLLKGEKWDYLLQKCTEVGVSRFVPVVSERCVVRGLARQERYQRIVQEAAEQARRGRVPRVEPSLEFAAACQQAAAEHELCLLLWEGEPSVDMAAALRPVTSLALLVGPEGGYSEAEVTLAHQCGIISITLGPRILRAETAGLVAATIALYSFGDMQREGTNLSKLWKLN